MVRYGVLEGTCRYLCASCQNEVGCICPFVRGKALGLCSAGVVLGSAHQELSVAHLAPFQSQPQGYGAIVSYYSEANYASPLQ